MRWRAWPECARRRKISKAVKCGSGPCSGDIGGNSKFDRRRSKQAGGGRLRQAERAKPLVLMDRARGRPAGVVRHDSGYLNAVWGGQMHMDCGQQQLCQQNERSEVAEIALLSPAPMHAHPVLQRTAHYSETRWQPHVLLYNRRMLCPLIARGEPHRSAAIFRHRHGARLAARFARIYLHGLYRLLHPRTLATTRYNSRFFKQE